MSNHPKCSIKRCDNLVSFYSEEMVIMTERKDEERRRVPNRQEMRELLLRVLKSERNLTDEYIAVKVEEIMLTIYGY